MSDPETTRQETGARPVEEETAAETVDDRGGEAPAKRDPEELRRDIEQTRAELGDTVEALSRKADVKAQLSQKIDERKAALRGRGETLKSRATEVRGRVSGATPEDAKRTASRVAQNAEERPFPAIGVAFGAGLVLGWLLKRR
jgi:ElaB/YqjD/DUF883 family membrane-anchored ribosome-binding protein